MSNITVVTYLDENSAIRHGLNQWGYNTLTIDPANLTQEQRDELASIPYSNVNDKKLRDITQLEIQNPFSHLPYSKALNFSNKLPLALTKNYEMVKTILDTRIAIKQEFNKNCETDRITIDRHVQELFTKYYSKLAKEYVHRDILHDTCKPNLHLLSYNDSITLPLTGIELNPDDLMMFMRQNNEFKKLEQEVMTLVNKENAEWQLIREQNRKEEEKKQAEKKRQEEEENRIQEELIEKQHEQEREFIIQHGTESQKARMEEGLLPVKEIKTAMHEFYFKPFSEFNAYKHLDKYQLYKLVPDEITYDIEDIEKWYRNILEIENSPLTELSEEQYAKLVAIRKVLTDNNLQGTVECITRDFFHNDECFHSVNLIQVLLTVENLTFKECFNLW